MSQVLSKNINVSSFIDNIVACNSDMYVGEIQQFGGLQAEGQNLMRSAMMQLNLSARAYHPETRTHNRGFSGE